MKAKHWLIGILLLAALLRFFGLSRGDVVNDEAFIAFRAIGMVDFDEGRYQTTPLEWFDPAPPAWTRLSFHDHPPLVFLAQHLSQRLFGDTRFAFRLPSALFGVLSVYLLYCIGTRLRSEETGLIAAAVYAATVNAVYISRTGMQEAAVIFFLLLACYSFLRALENRRYLIFAGLAVGLGTLAKYTALIAAPALIASIVLFERRFLRSKELWLGIALGAAVFSPVLIYNASMYRAVGHFDFQFSHVFGQEHSEWQVQPGKEIGTLGERVGAFVPRLVASNSWLFLVLAAASIAALAVRLRNADERKAIAFLFLWLLFICILLLFVGPAYRFLTMLAPFLSLALGYAASLALTSTAYRRAALYALIAVIGFETAYAYNNQIAYAPHGPEPALSSRIRSENPNLGYNELDGYLEHEFAQKVPALTFDVKYRFLEELRAAALDEALVRGYAPHPFFIVYGGELNDAAKLWVFERRLVYRAWPILREGDYRAIVAVNGADYFDRAGFSEQYFIRPADGAFDPQLSSTVAGIEPTVIRNPLGEPAFFVYKRTLRSKP